MIKQMIQYKAPSGRNVSRTFYFNLTEFEVQGEMELEVLYARFKKFQDEVIDVEQHTMTPPEIREMLNMVKVLIRYAYGEYKATPEGGEIWKDEQDPNVWNRFVASGGFNAFVQYLFKDGNRANTFMTQIWPDTLREGTKSDSEVVSETPEPVQAEPYASEDNVPSIDGNPTLEVVPDISSIGSDAPDEEKAWHDYARNELLAMSDDDFDALANRSKKGNNLPFQLIQIGMERSNRGTTE